MIRIAVTNRKLCIGNFSERLNLLAASSYYHAIVLREKDLTEAEYLKLAEKVKSICLKYDKPLILHQFVSVAIKLKTPVHLPLSILESLQESEKEKFLKIGTSVHSLDELKRAEKAGATYCFAGHIFETDCKKNIPGRGISFLKTIIQNAEIPVYAIGGIHRENEFLIKEANASGACFMSSCMQETI